MPVRPRYPPIRISVGPATIAGPDGFSPATSCVGFICSGGVGGVCPAADEAVSTRSHGTNDARIAMNLHGLVRQRMCRRTVAHDSCATGNTRLRLVGALL